MDSLRDVFLLIIGVLILCYASGLVILVWLDVRVKLERARKDREAKRMWKDP